MAEVSDDETTDPLLAACAAVLSITSARETIDVIPQGVVDRWWNAPVDEVDDVLDRRIKVPFRERRHVAFLDAERSATEARERRDMDALRRSIHALVLALWQTSASNEYSLDGQHAAALATLELLSVARHRKRTSVRATIERMNPDRSNAVKLPFVLGMDWESYVETLRTIRQGLQSAEAPIVVPPPRLTGAADALVEGRGAQLEVAAPIYDSSDESRRVESVTIHGFRGSPTTLSVDFVKGRKPVSALVFGDNGSGKSTLADAIEFGLQGRIGRSVAFDSALGPSAASFATEEEPDVVVTLDDGSEVRRRLIGRGDGKLAVDSRTVRPGFRLAPIALKRQDVLRFLDTGALARGHVFFDYFPVNADEMAIRPEEQLERLDDEAYRARIHRTRLAESLATALAVEVDDVTSKEGLLRIVREQLTGGESLNLAQKDGTWAAVREDVRNPVEQLIAIQNRLTAIKKQRERGIETLNPVRYRQQAALLAQALEGIGDQLTGAFKTITGADHVDRVDVLFGRSGPVSLDIVIELTSGRRCFPQQLFSEGYRDLLAILFFAVVARRAADLGQAKVLILDDVFQSVDASIRSGTVDYLLRHFSDWQLIVTVHDRLWFEQLRAAFSRHSHAFVERELRRWTFYTGISLVTTPSELTTALERQLETGDPSAICGASGLLLERACDQLSARLGASISRRVGDRYTLGDLWPGVFKACRRTSLQGVCVSIDGLYSLRNLVGAHYNEWAETLSLDEAYAFGEAVLEFVRSTWCDVCRDWVGKFDQSIRCRCGALSV